MRGGLAGAGREQGAARREEEAASSRSEVNYGVGYQIIVRNRGRRESLFFLVIAVVFGLSPVVGYYTVPKTPLASLILGAGLCIPFLVLSVWRLFKMEALALSNDGNTLVLLRRRIKGTEKIEIATSNVKSIGLAGHALAVHLKVGAALQLEVELPLYAQPALIDLAKTIGVSYASIPFDD